MPLDREHKDKLSKAMRNAWARVKTENIPAVDGLTEDQVFRWLWDKYGHNKNWEQWNVDWAEWKRCNNV